METRRLNTVEVKYIEKELAPYGDKSLTGGSFTIDDNENFIYHLSVSGFYPWSDEAKKIAARIKESMYADELYIQGIKF